jgi:hypothetical protein
MIPLIQPPGWPVQQGWSPNSLKPTAAQTAGQIYSNAVQSAFFNASGNLPVYFAYRRFTNAEIVNPNPPGGQVYTMIAAPVVDGNNVAAVPLAFFGKCNQDAGGYGVGQNIQVRWNGIAQDWMTIPMIGAGANTRFAVFFATQSTAFSAAGRTIQNRAVEISFATANLTGGNAANFADMFLYYVLEPQP